MATYGWTLRFSRDFKAMSPKNQDLFLRAVGALVEDLNRGVPPRPGLRVKRIQRTERVWEMSFAADGRATFEYGDARREGEAHVIWRRVGTHAVLDNA